jgi:hypothetical protein
MSNTRDWVSIPFLLKRSTIFVDHVQKEEMNEPQVVRVATVKHMQCFQAVEECSPPTNKLFAKLYPEPLDAGVVR